MYQLSIWWSCFQYIRSTNVTDQIRTLECIDKYVYFPRPGGLVVEIVRLQIQSLLVLQ